MLLFSDIEEEFVQTNQQPIPQKDRDQYLDVEISFELLSEKPNDTEKSATKKESDSTSSLSEDSGNYFGIDIEKKFFIDEVTDDF